MTYSGTKNSKSFIQNNDVHVIKKPKHPHMSHMYDDVWIMWQWPETDASLTSGSQTRILHGQHLILRTILSAGETQKTSWYLCVFLHHCLLLKWLSCSHGNNRSNAWERKTGYQTMFSVKLWMERLSLLSLNPSKHFWEY